MSMSLTGCGNIIPGPIPFFPTDLTGLVTWFDATDNATLITGSGAASSWSDKSGTINPITIGSFAFEPTLTTINSKQALLFDGANDSLAISQSPISSFTEMSCFVVFQNVSAFTGTPIFGIGTFGQLVMAIETSGVQLILDGATMNGTANTSTPHYFAATRNTSQIAALRIDGVQVATGSLGGATVAVGINNTCAGGDLNSGWFCNARIGEIILYNRQLTGPEITDVETYLSGKWSI